MDIRIRVHLTHFWKIRLFLALFECSSTGSIWCCQNWSAWKEPKRAQFSKKKCQMHPNSDVQLWNWFLTINSDSTHQKWMEFVFIVTCSIFLQSYWVPDNVILIFSNVVYYLQSVLSSRLKLVNFNTIQWLLVSFGVMVHVQVTSLTYAAKKERNWRFLGFLPCVIQRLY